MKLRTQLLIAFLVLAVLPLSGIVLYSHLSSQQAFCRAVEAESQLLAEETGKRLGKTRAELETRLERLASLPARSLVPGVGAYGEAIGVYADLVVRMGEATDLLEFCEFTPAAATTAAEPFFIFPSRTLARAIERLQKQARSLEASGLPYDYIEETLRQAIWERKRLDEEELAALEAASYQHWESELAPGDTLLLMTDGFAELLNGDEETMGYPRVAELFEAAVAKEPEEIITDLSSAAEAWTGGLPPQDDITFVVMRCKAT